MTAEHSPDKGSLESPTPDQNDGSQNATDQTADIQAIISEAVKSQTADLYNQLSSLTEQQKSQSSYIGKLEKQLKATPEDKAKADLKPNPLQEQIDSLNEFKQAALAKEQNIMQRERVLTLKEAVSKASKMDGGQSERYAKLLIAEEGDKIKVEETDGGFRTIYQADEDSQAVNIADYVSNHFQTDAGRAFLPVKSNPASGQSARGQATNNATRATHADMRAGRVNLADVSSGKVVIVD